MNQNGYGPGAQAHHRFIFGGNTGLTQSDLQRKRRALQGLAYSNTRRAPANAGEGLNAIGKALAWRMGNADVQEQEQAGQQKFSALQQGFMDKLKSGEMGGQPGGLNPAQHQAATQLRGVPDPKQPSAQAGGGYDLQSAIMEASGLAANPFASPGQKAQLMALQQLMMQWYGLDQKAQQATAQRQADLQSQKDLYKFKINNPMPTTAARNFQLAQEGGYQGNFHDYTMANKRAAATTVNLGQTSEKEEQKQRGKLLVDQFTAISEAAGNAQQQNAYLEQAKSINDNPMGDGNALPGPLKLKAGNIIVGLGFDPARIPGFETISDGQSFNGLVQNVVLSKMQAQKGPQTEGDAQRIADTVASLGNTPEARAFLLNSAISMNQMEMLKHRHWQEHYRANNTYDGAAYSWSQGLGGQKFVGRNRASGNVIFLPQFMERMRQEHPDASMEQILELWQSYD